MTRSNIPFSRFDLSYHETTCRAEQNQVINIAKIPVKKTGIFATRCIFTAIDITILLSISCELSQIDKRIVTSYNIGYKRHTNCLPQERRIET